MPILTLKYKLPEEQSEADIALNAGLMHSILHDIGQYRRQLYKYEERELIPRAEVEQKLAELLAELPDIG